MEQQKFLITKIKVEHAGLSEIRTYRQTDFIVKAESQSALTSSCEEDPLLTIKDEPLEGDDDFKTSSNDLMNNEENEILNVTTTVSLEDSKSAGSETKNYNNKINNSAKLFQRMKHKNSKSKQIQTKESFRRSTRITKHSKTMCPNTNSIPESESDDDCETANDGFEIFEMLLDDGKSEKRLQCLLCPKSFRYPSEMARHKLTHSNERPFKCDMCVRSFNRSSNLVVHRRIHTEERPYQCAECDKTFAQRNSLTAHSKIHSGKKPYQCDECGKTFTQYANLNVHRRSHTGERPFQCDECGKTFTQVANLVAHRRLHTGEKPFHCEECKKSFTLHAHLISHRRVHSKDRPFRCDVCGRSFNIETRLLVHEKTHNVETNVA